CGKHIHMNEMVLFPAEGVREDQTAPEVMPWLARKKIGRISAWFRTIGMALVSPQRLMQLTPVHSSDGQAWWFALICQTIYGTLGFGVFLLFPLMLMLGGVPGGAAGIGGIFALFFLIS